MQLQKFTGKKICVAVSGGVDSTVLLHYLKMLENCCGFTLSAVHCEHGIRGEESKRDMHFVLALCESYSVPCFAFEEDCIEKSKREKVSLETAARDFRRQCFSSLLESGKVDYIATAHHLQDEAETVLFRLARGSGLSGVSAMKEQDGYFLRPLLTWNKQKILQYAKENGLSHCEDSTNAQLDATRNVLRWKVLPALENAVPGARIWRNLLFLPRKTKTFYGGKAKNCSWRKVEKRGCFFLTNVLYFLVRVYLLCGKWV